MNKTILIASILAVYVIAYSGIAGSAYAQYAGSVTSEPATLEETLELAKQRVAIAAANPASGSGTPYLSADRVVGSLAISAAIFGGIAGVLFFKGKHGKYAAQGRG